MSTSSSRDFARFNVKVLAVPAVAAIATPVPLSATPLWVSWARIKAVKPARAGANAGIVYLGDSATNDSQPYPLAAGDNFDVAPYDTGLIDLSQLWIDGLNVGDGVVVIYQQPLGSL